VSRSDDRKLRLERPIVRNPKKRLRFRGNNASYRLPEARMKRYRTGGQGLRISACFASLAGPSIIAAWIVGRNIAPSPAHAGPRAARQEAKSPLDH